MPSTCTSVCLGTVQNSPKPVPKPPHAHSSLRQTLCTQPKLAELHMTCPAHVQILCMSPCSQEPKHVSNNGRPGARLQLGRGNMRPLSVQRGHFTTCLLSSTYQGLPITARNKYDPINPATKPQDTSRCKKYLHLTLHPAQTGNWADAGLCVSLQTRAAQETHAPRSHTTDEDAWHAGPCTGCFLIHI